MTDETRPRSVTKEALQREAARLSGSFKQIGAFVFQFSQLEFSIRVVLGGILQLTDEQFDAVTAPYDFLILCSARVCAFSEPEESA